ncbi:hypothetical protein [Legionella fallonii]|uniref:Cofactor-independent phosphoglycerate mutase n=1 Tax=Legionella fallonii LLAP-10 TaxID=1212491 RepID=A0A098G5Q4_9GAMM|nr:hypothetical protein [Legionella fallonii]CEG56825.1 conserved protein of unknown function [Legionella fallonii LLAP-10]
MDVVINSDCSFIPEHSKPLMSEGTVSLNFLQCLGHDPFDPPLADMLSHSLQLEEKWWVLSPISWQATHNDAMIVAANKELHLNEETSKYWFQLYADYLADEDIKLHYYDAETWLLHVANRPMIKAKPVHKLLSRSLMPELEQLDSSMYWQKFFTEGQMFFASQPAQSVINGVWLWGGAPLSGKSAVTVCADEQLISMAKVCSDKVTLYHPSVSLKQYSILLVSHMDILSKQHQEELKKISAHWYWNNTAYTSGELNWFTRLWSALTHAY